MYDVAIIGHGKTPEGKGWGSRIDSCNTIVRMWDWHWQDLTDYGSRYDLGFLEVSTKQCGWFDAYNERFPSRGWLVSPIKPTAWQPPGAGVFAMVYQGRWVKMGHKLGGVGTTGRLKYTRGVIAACWVLENIACERVVLVGFDNVFTAQALSPEEGFSEAYRNHPSTRSFKGYRGGGTKYHNHDYVAEGKIMRYLAEENKRLLVHAQEIWT